MDRYIKAQELINKVESKAYDFGDTVIGMINEASTIDVTEVARCGKCEFHDNEEFMCMCEWSPCYKRHTGMTYFCANGEEKET